MVGFLAALGICAAIGVIFATMIAGQLARFGFSLPPEHRRIGCIDGLRGYLALAVMIHHFFVWVQLTRLGTGWATPQIHFINELGAGGVALFFMTTGMVFYPRILAGYRSTFWPGLYTARVFRIVPLVIVSLGVITVILSTRNGKPLDAEYLRAITVWFSTISEPPLLGDIASGRTNAYVRWSLWFEWLFYFSVLPLCAMFMDRVRSQGLPTWLVPVTLLGAAAVARLILELTGSDLEALHYLPLFAVGMLAFEAQSRPVLRDTLAKPMAAIPALAALAFGMLFAQVPYDLALPFFSMFFVCIACGNSLSGALRCRGALVLGECSFGIYLFHGVVLDVLFVDAHALPNYLATTALPLLLPGAVVALVLATAATYLLVERPAMRWGKALANKLAETPARPVSPQRQATA